MLSLNEKKVSLGSVAVSRDVLVAAVGGLLVGCVAAVGMAHILPTPSFCKRHNKEKQFAVGATEASRIKKDKKKKVDGGAITTHYWNGRGLMEIPRQMMKACGMTFTDGRHTDFTGDSACNLGRMPNVETAHGSIGQSRSINFYVAAVNGLLGDDAFQAAKCIELQEHVKECYESYHKYTAKVTAGRESSDLTDEEIQQWFQGGAMDLTGKANAETKNERYLTWYMGRIEASITGTDGFAVGNKLTYGDFALYGLFGEHLTEDETDREEDRRYPFGSKNLLQAALDAHPKIAASIRKVAQNPGVVAHLAARGPQGF